VESPQRPATPPGKEFSSRTRLYRVAIVGAGRVGSALARTMTVSGWDIDFVMGSSPDSSAARSLAAEIGCAVARSSHEIVSGSDLVLLCVPDAALESVVADLAYAYSQLPPVPQANPRFVGHTAGSLGTSVLDSLASAGWATFALHPVVSIADRMSGPQILKDRYAGITASPKAREMALEIARSLDMHPFEIAEEIRPAYHLSCVIASNFMVTLAAMAARVARGAGLEDPTRFLVPLMRSTLDNLESRSPDEALTGPVARGDTPTVEAHLQVLESVDPQLSKTYATLAEATLKLADLDDHRREEMESLLSKWCERSGISGSVAESISGAI
jgi:predicted short-subunit dehydrogenase-like oxidoreductase (DUF2520 family)